MRGYKRNKHKFFSSGKWENQITFLRILFRLEYNKIMIMRLVLCMPTYPTYGSILVCLPIIYSEEKKVILISCIKEIDPLRDGYLGN